MNRALKTALSKPEILAQDPNIVERVLNSPQYKIIEKLLEHGDECMIGDDPLPGVTLNFDKVDIHKNYPTSNDYSYLIRDVEISDNIPVSQILHNNKGSRILIPYLRGANTSENQINTHISRLKQSILEVCDKLGHPTSMDNLIVNTDPGGNFIIQIRNKDVENLEKNKIFTNLLADHIQKKYADLDLCAAIDGGYRVFKYNENHQKYPLLADKSEQNVSVLHKLIYNPANPTQPVTININIVNNTFNGNNNIQNTQQSNNSTLTVNDIAVADFVLYIKTNKPSWYKESQWVLLSDIKKQFEMFNPSVEMSDISFNSRIGKKIGDHLEVKNIKRRHGRAALLKPYDRL